MLNILNLYSGIGGNRKLWKDVKVTAVEINKEIAEVYKDNFPNDRIVVEDAHEYLLNNFKEFDFIWSSPPCQTHSSFRHNICVRFRGTKAVYPDMRLYQEILFLKYNFNGKFVVENVKPYYNVLIEAREVQRHLFWANFKIFDMKTERENIRTAQIPDLQKMHGFNLDKYKLPNKRQILRNCVHPKLGLHVLKCAV